MMRTWAEKLAQRCAVPAQFSLQNASGGQTHHPSTIFDPMAHPARSLLLGPRLTALVYPNAIVASGANHSELAVAHAARDALEIASQVRARVAATAQPCPWDPPASPCVQVSGVRLEPAAAEVRVESILVHASVPAVAEGVARDPLLFDRLGGAPARGAGGCGGVRLDLCPHSVCLCPPPAPPLPSPLCRGHGLGAGAAAGARHARRTQARHTVSIPRTRTHCLPPRVCAGRAGPARASSSRRRAQSQWAAAPRSPRCARPCPPPPTPCTPDTHTPAPPPCFPGRRSAASAQVAARGRLCAASAGGRLGPRVRCPGKEVAALCCAVQIFDWDSEQGQF